MFFRDSNPPQPFAYGVTKNEFEFKLLFHSPSVMILGGIPGENISMEIYDSVEKTWNLTTNVAGLPPTNGFQHGNIIQAPNQIVTKDRAKYSLSMTCDRDGPWGNKGY